METFTIGLGNRWWFRAFGRNPMLRLSDRIEALVYVFAVLLTVVAVPIAGAIGTAVHEERTRLYLEEAKTRHQVTAVATEEGQVVVHAKDIAFEAEATWSDAADIHRGVVIWPNRPKVGDRQLIWVNTQGEQVGRTYFASQADGEALGIALAVWLAVAQASAAVAYLVRCSLNHRRYAQWEREINALATTTADGTTDHDPKRTCVVRPYHHYEEYGNAHFPNPSRHHRRRRRFAGLRSSRRLGSL